MQHEPHSYPVGQFDFMRSFECEVSEILASEDITTKDCTRVLRYLVAWKSNTRAPPHFDASWEDWKLLNQYHPIMIQKFLTKTFEAHL